MIGQEVTFDHHRFNELFYLGDVEIGLPEFTPSYEQRPRGGAIVRGMQIGTATIRVTLVVKPVRGEEPRAALSALMSWLDVDGPRRLTLSSDGGLWRMAVPTGAPEMQDNGNYDIVSVEFMQTDPMLFGKKRTVNVTQGSSSTFVVGGDAPTRPTIRANAAHRNATNGTWGLALDSGESLLVSIPTSSASTVDIDCGERVCHVNGVATAPTLASDWFELKPGLRTITHSQGTGTAFIEWYERWHR